MAMNVGGSEEEQGVMAAINTTPLVDVMLVLLIIFLITIPVINKTVKVDLPKAVNIPNPGPTLSNFTINNPDPLVGQSVTITIDAKKRANAEPLCRYEP